jgi:DNA segregation ATPase FtsK/SpoIIIE-like protein
VKRECLDGGAGILRVLIMMHRNQAWVYVTGVVCGLMGLGGCTVYVQNAPPPEPVVYQSPPPAPAPEVVVQPEPYQPPPADVVTVYHGDLDPYGHWVDVAPYGSCWVPNAVPFGWAPYTVGHWVYSDVGWTWVSVDVETNWGPVVYHYGSWYEAPGVGWCWVPGVTWAPAWVAWREGGGYMAWAPLPPQVVFGGVFGVAVVNRYVPANRYVVVDERYADDRNIHEHIVRNDITIVNRTTNITNITIVNGRVENHGVAVEHVERVTGRQIERVEVTKAATPEEARRLAAEGKPAFYAPPAVEQAQAKREEDRVAHQQKVQENQQQAAERKDQAEQKRVEAQDDREKAAADAKAKQEAEQADRQKAEQEKVDQEKAQREQAEADAKAKADQEKMDREKAAADAKAKQEQEVADRQKAAQEKSDQEKADREQAVADAKAKQEQQHADQAQAAAEQKAKAQSQQQQKQQPKNAPKPKQPDEGQPPQQQQQH